MPGDPLDKLLDDLAGEYDPARTPPPAPPPAPQGEGSATAASKPVASRGGGTTAAPSEASLPLGDDEMHPALRELLRPAPPIVPLDLASDAAFVPSSTTSGSPLPAAQGEGPGVGSAPGAQAVVRPFVPSSSTLPVAPPEQPVVVRPFVPSSSIAVTPPRPPPAPSLKVPVAPRGAPPPGYAVAAPAPTGAPEPALLASIQRDELAALQREQERLRREEEIARMRAAQEQRRQQEEAARREAEVVRALRAQAEQFLKQLDPYSVEGLWFNEFARKHPDRLTAAITYLREVKKMG